MREAKDPHAHHRLDYVVAQAVKILDDSKCPKCGVLIWHGYSTDSHIEFECEDVICHACAEKDRVESKEKNKTDGATKVVRAKPAFEGDPLPGRRAFFERMAKEKELEASRKSS